MRKKICGLKKQDAIDCISGREMVYYKHGFWNSYEKLPVSDVITRIQNSVYGADVDLDEATGDLFVCTPTDSDMW